MVRADTLTDFSEVESKYVIIILSCQRWKLDMQPLYHHARGRGKHATMTPPCQRWKVSRFTLYHYVRGTGKVRYHYTIISVMEGRFGTIIP